MTISRTALPLLIAVVLTGCLNDPMYHSGFTNGSKNRKGEQMQVTAPSRPTPTPSNRLTTPVDPTGEPVGR